MEAETSHACDSSLINVEVKSEIGVRPGGVREQEYDVQHFGFTAQSLSDGVYNSLNDYVHDCMSAMSEYITKEFDDVTAEEVKEASKSMLPIFIKAFDRAFDKLESYLMDLFHIPSNVLLPEDRAQLTQYTPAQELNLDKCIQQLETEIKNLTYVNSQLQQQLIDVAVIQEKYDKMLEKLTQLQETCIQANVPDIKEALVFTVNKANMLREVIAKYQPKPSTS